jgi:hypothetical protein
LLTELDRAGVRLAVHHCAGSVQLGLEVVDHVEDAGDLLENLALRLTDDMSLQRSEEEPSTAAPRLGQRVSHGPLRISGALLGWLETERASA